MRNRGHYIFPVLILMAVSCGSKPELPPAIAKAFVGPWELDLLTELAPDAPIAATLEHGEPVDVIQRRRRFAKVRSPSGGEGWVDGRMLLSASNMARFRGLAMNAARLPTEAKATAYDVLNVHTDPNRGAPSFYQMQEGILVEVVAHHVFPRVPYEPPPDDALMIQPLNSYDPPGQRAPGSGPVDDWSLVRLRDGRAGWVLTRMLVMAIPDEVAQYAGGRRITSYASLGQVDDNGEIKHHWLWTTISGRGRPYQFDRFRVFVWSLRRHRYETAYIQRNVVGYYPVVVTHPDPAAETKEKPRFSLILREDDGRFYRQTYEFSGYRVRLIEKNPWDAPRKRTADSEYVQLPPAREPSLFEKLVDRVMDVVSGGDKR